MCGDCRLTVFTSDAFRLLRCRPDNGAARRALSPASTFLLRNAVDFFFFYGLKKGGNRGDKQGCIWLIFFPLINRNELPHISALASGLLLSLPTLYPPCGDSPAFPPHSRAAHLTEPDTEICAANSLHSHGSVWCHNWHTIDLCLLLQRPEWLMSRASCHNRPCPGLLPLGCSPHSFLSSAICCG